MRSKNSIALIFAFLAVSLLSVVFLSQPALAAAGSLKWIDSANNEVSYLEISDGDIASFVYRAVLDQNGFFNIKLYEKDGTTLKSIITDTTYSNTPIAGYLNVLPEHYGNSEGQGTYKLKIYTKDKWNFHTDTITLFVKPEIPNKEPVALFTITPQTGYAPLLIYLDASESYDEDGTIESYEWFIQGEENVLTGINQEYVFENPGEYFITLRITDNDGARAFNTKKIVVKQQEIPNKPPIAIFSVMPETGEAPLLVLLDASESYDEDGTIEKYYWFINNLTILFYEGLKTNKTFSEPGKYTISLKVVDNDGAIGIVGKTIIVKEPQPQNHPPVADFTFSPQNPGVYQIVYFDGSNSYDPDGDYLYYFWDFNEDGVFDSFEKKPTYVFSEPGTYKVKLKVSDLKLSDSITKNVVVAAKLDVEDISCFDKIVVNHNQTCSVLVKSEGSPITGATVKMYFDDDSAYGTCITNRLGNCRIDKEMAEEGTFVVYATAQKPGYISDLDKEPKKLFEVYRERYEIKGLRVYADENFSHESYEFFRGENLYVKFQVKEQNTGTIITQNIVTKATLVSQGHETAELDKIGISGDYFAYKLAPIPLKYGFIGDSQIFAFAFNFTDGSGGQQQVYLLIKNNLPEIKPIIEDIKIKKGQSATIDLSYHEYDKEDEYSETEDLYWIHNYDSEYFSATLNKKQLTIVGLEKGTGFLTLSLFDWDGDFESQKIAIIVWEESTYNHPPVLDSIGNKEVFENQQISFFVSAYDEDGDELEFSASPLPSGASFLSQMFEWTPTSSQVGSHQITFTVTDGEFSDTETIIIKVKPTDAPELIADINGPYQGYPYENILLDASGSIGNIQYYVFDFGDGIIQARSSPKVFHHYDGSQKSYTIKLTVIDYYGNTVIDTTTVEMLEKEEKEEKTESIYIGRINIYGIYSYKEYASVNGEDLVISIVVENSGDSDQKDLSITALIPELGIKAKTSAFKLNQGERTSKKLVVPLYNPAQGEYYIKLIIGNDAKTRVKYRYFVVE